MSVLSVEHVVITDDSGSKPHQRDARRRDGQIKFGIYVVGQLFVLDQGCGRDVSPNRVGRQFLADNHARKLRGNTGTITSRFFFLLMKVLQCRTHFNCEY
jgi:hypothetical protein